MIYTSIAKFLAEAEARQKRMKQARKVNARDWSTIAEVCRTSGKDEIVGMVDAWQQGKHKRDKNGRFTKGSGSSQSYVGESKETSGAQPNNPQKSQTVGAHANKRKMNSYMRNIFSQIKGQFKSVDRKKFSKTIENTRDKCQPDVRWRVDVHTPQQYEEKGATCFQTEDGTCAAVTKGHDIISVCSYKGAKLTGKHAMAWAIENGGDRLDSFAGNLVFYYKCGFQPVSYCDFTSNPQYQPTGWNQSYAKQPVIAMKYTGRQFDQIMAEYGANVSKFGEKVKHFDQNGYDDMIQWRDSHMD